MIYSVSLKELVTVPRLISVNKHSFASNEADQQ